MNLNLTQQFMAARRCGTPLIAIKTFDPEATMQTLQGAMTKVADTPIIQWDSVNAWRPRNDAGDKAMAVALAGLGGDNFAVRNPIQMLMSCLDLPYQEDTTVPCNPVVFVLNAQHALTGGMVDCARGEFIQGLSNLRQPFRDSLRSIVLLSPDFNFPPELQHDIVILDEPLPSDTEIESIITSTTQAVGLSVPDDQRADAVTALRGLVAFEAETATAMSITKSGGEYVLKLDELWHRKIQMISATKGLSVWRGGQKFGDLGGIEEFKRRFRRIIAGRAKPKVIVWIDEIEKAMGGVEGDGSGTAKDQLAVILGEMQDKSYTGALFVGPPGAAKSAAAKALANEAGCITIKLDPGGAMGEGLVGQAQNDIRNIFKVIEAVAGPGGAFFIATSNDIRVVRPELKRRMKKGIWYFDLPTEDEKPAIVDIYSKKYPDVDTADWANVNSNDYTGAEIESCFQTAWEESVSLSEASRNIIPVAVSDKDGIERLRREAAGRYNSASYAGAYRLPTATIKTSTRRILANEEE